MRLLSLSFSLSHVLFSSDSCAFVRFFRYIEVFTIARDCPASRSASLLLKGMEILNFITNSEKNCIFSYCNYYVIFFFGRIKQIFLNSLFYFDV